MAALFEQSHDLWYNALMEAATVSPQFDAEAPGVSAQGGVPAAHAVHGSPTERQWTRFVFKNLGPVDEATLELRPLTILAGPNNTGKSTISYTLYGLLAKLENKNMIKAFLNSDRYDKHPVLTSSHHATLSQAGEALIELTREDFILQAKTYLTQLTEVHSRNLHHVFNVNEKELADAKVDIIPDEQQIGKFFDALDSKLFSDYGSASFAFEREGGDEASQLHVRIQYKNSLSGITNNVLRNLAVLLDGLLFVPQIPRPRMFTSDRAGLGLLYKELDAHKSALLMDLEKSDHVTTETLTEKLARYVLPVHNNISFIRDLPDIVGKTGRFGDDPEKKYHRKIEDALGVIYYVVNDGIRVKSLPGAEHKFDIPYYLASSATRELACLYFYLKHQACQFDLLFIDEPEAHLDPRNQIMLAHLLVNCVNANIYVFLNTHSDFLVTEINNLIMLDTGIPRKQGFFEMFPQYVGQDSLDIDKVSVYVCAKRKLIPSRKSTSGFATPSFDSAINDLNNVTMTLDTMIRKSDDY